MLQYILVYIHIKQRDSDIVSELCSAKSHRIEQTNINNMYILSTWRIILFFPFVYFVKYSHTIAYLCIFLLTYA